MTARQRPCGRRGQSAVEVALALPLALLVFVGVFEGARLAAVYVGMVNAAREGARAGSVSGATNAQITTAVQNTIVAFGDGLSTITPTICPNTVGGTATCSPLGPVTRSSGGALTVTVSYNFQFLPQLAPYIPAISLTTTAVGTIG